MAETAYLVDSNVLLRWVKPDHTDYGNVVSAIDSILGRNGLLVYTSQNVAEFWNACTRPADRNGYGFRRKRRIERRTFLKNGCACSPIVSRFIKHGAKS